MSVEEDMEAQCADAFAAIEQSKPGAKRPCKGKLRMKQEYLDAGSREQIKADASDGCRDGCQCENPKPEFVFETANGQQIEYIVATCLEENTATDPNAHTLGTHISPA